MIFESIMITFFLVFLVVGLYSFGKYNYKSTTSNDLHPQIQRRWRHNDAQPVVQTTTCSNVIYTIPTNDPNRFSTNISTTLRHHYDLPPSYDQVVIQTVQTPQTPTPPPTQIVTTPTQLPERPPNYTEVPK